MREPKGLRPNTVRVGSMGLVVVEKKQQIAVWLGNGGWPSRQTPKKAVARRCTGPADGWMYGTSSVRRIYSRTSV